MNELKKIRVRALLSMQQALVGEITENMKAVAVRIEEEDLVKIRFYFYTPIEDVDLENVSDIEGEFLASLHPVKVVVDSVYSPKGEKIDYWGEWVFKRKDV